MPSSAETSETAPGAGRGAGLGPDDAQVARLVVRAGLVPAAKVREVEERIGRSASRARGGSSLRAALVDRGLLDREGEAKLDALLAAERDPNLRIPGYEILEVLGKGGMGVVYLARQLSLERLVALKVLDPEQAKSTSYLERFLTEARVLARLNHENIIAGIDVGEANGYHYFAMELVEGESLDAVIAREGALPDKRALRIGAQICGALAHAQRAGLVHRDVKPQNIMLTRHDQAKLCDLGLAMTGSEREAGAAGGEERGQAVGTPHYVSPEQARGERAVDIRSDLYSLGATLYHAVTGKTPFEGSSAMVLMTRHLTEEPVPAHKRRAGVSKATSQLIQKMMAKAREDRYQDPLECQADMERILEGKAPQGAPPERAGAPVSTASSARSAAALIPSGEPPVRRRAAVAARPGGKGGATAGFIFVVALTCGAGYLLWRHQEAVEIREGRAGAPEVSEEESRAADGLLRQAVAFYAERPGQREEARGLFLAVIEAHPHTRAAESARTILESDFGEQH